MFRDDEEVDQVLHNVSMKDDACKAEKENKSIENKVEPRHIGNTQLDYLDQRIMLFADKDKKEKAQVKLRFLVTQE